MLRKEKTDARQRENLYPTRISNISDRLSGHLIRERGAKTMRMVCPPPVRHSNVRLISGAQRWTLGFRGEGHETYFYFFSRGLM